MFAGMMTGFTDVPASIESTESFVADRANVLSRPSTNGAIFPVRNQFAGVDIKSEKSSFRSGSRHVFPIAHFGGRFPLRRTKASLIKVSIMFPSERFSSLASRTACSCNPSGQEKVVRAIRRRLTGSP